MSSPVGRRIILAGIIAGTIDIGSASLISHRGPTWICRAIAGGVLGLNSFHAGDWAELLGLLIQWLIGISVAGIYVWATGQIRPLRRNWILGGVIAGIVTFGVMNYVVVPLSALHLFQHFTVQSFLENLAAIVLFGLIIAFTVRDRESPG